ncbi:MAG: AraC family transcriptional regulator [Clostridiales bacterium]|nr:AraC family transcriptional regulator [Clostridiales bacterium]
MASVQEYIRENLGKRLSLNDVAAVFNFSPSYLSRLFTKNADCGFVEFITVERVEAAKEMFARREGRVNEVAERLGFESAFYFSKVFKKHAGVSPREYLQALTDSGAGDSNIRLIPR